MEGTKLISLLAAAYALFTSYSRNKQLEEQQSNIDELEKNYNQIEQVIVENEEKNAKSFQQAQTDLSLHANVKFGFYAATISKIAIQAFVTVRNTSKTQTYQIVGAALQPLIGQTRLGSTSTGFALVNKLPAEQELKPGEQIDICISYKYAKFSDEVNDLIRAGLAKLLNLGREMVNLLNTKKVSKVNATTSKCWIWYSVPNVDFYRTYNTISSENVPTDIEWCGTSFNSVENKTIDTQKYASYFNNYQI